MCEKNKRKAFTLIELLVVVSVIAILLSVLVPSLNKARNAAKALICQSNLKQVGSFLLMAAMDNKDRFFPESSSNSTQYRGWISQLYPYWKGSEKIFHCPMTRLDHADLWFQSSDLKYFVSPNDPGTIIPGTQRSYNLNNWVLNPSKETGNVDGFPAQWYWRKRVLPSSFRADIIPLIGDAAGQSANGAWPQETDYPTSTDTIAHNEEIRQTGGMKRVFMNRHRDGWTIWAFLDGSARKVGVKELYAIKWHRNYSLRNAFTVSGGSTKSGIWKARAPWAERFKDY